MGPYRRLGWLAGVAAGLVAGSAMAQEPGLEGRNDIVLQDGFEASDWYSQWGRSEAPNNTSLISDGSSFRGSSHLRVSVPQGEHYGTSFAFNFAELRDERCSVPSLAPSFPKIGAHRT